MLLALTHTLASNVKNLLKVISLPISYFYGNVLKNAHLVLTPTKTINVCLVKVALNVLVHKELIVLAVTCTGEEILLTTPTGKVSLNLQPIKSK